MSRTNDLVRVGCICLALFQFSAAAESWKPPAPEPTPEETLVLELINRLRANPRAEGTLMAGKYRSLMSGFKVDWDMFSSEMDPIKPAQPLVFNLALLAAARNHSNYMNLNSQTHEEAAGLPGFTGKTFADRCRAAGYPSLWVGEDIYRNVPDVLYSHVGLVVDVGEGPGGMQTGRGHRVNMTDPNYREAGTGIVPLGKRLTVTHEFGIRQVPRLAGGVVYTDKNRNCFYDIGEGIGGVKISSSDGSSTTTWPSGAFSLELKGLEEVTLTAEFQGKSYSETFKPGAGNIKFDWRIPQAGEVEAVDRLLAGVDSVHDKKSSSYFAALGALADGSSGIGVDPARQKKIRDLTSKVGEELDAHKQAVLEILRASELTDFQKMAAEHRAPYAGTVAETWFSEAQSVRNAVLAEKAYKHRVSAGEKLPAAKLELRRQLLALQKQLIHAEFLECVEELLKTVTP